MSKYKYPVIDETDLDTRELDKFGIVRCILISGEVYMIGTDVARCLGYKSPSSTIAKFVKPEDKTTFLLRKSGSGYVRMVTFINEVGINQLVMRSESPRALEIQDWLARVVMPAVKRHNGIFISENIAALYALDKNAAIKQIEETLERDRKLKAENDEYKELCRMLGCSKGSCSVGVLSKVLAQKGYDIGRNRLLQWMRDNGYLSKQATMYNVPLQKYIEAGLFEVNVKKLIAYVTSDPKRYVHIPMITPKGQLVIMNDFIRQYNTFNHSKLSKGFIKLHPKKGGRYEQFLKHYSKRKAN